MPVSMMIPIVGSSPKVSGSSSVMPASGPRPGRTPTTVPHRQPMKQYASPFQESATANPPMSWSNPLISPLPGGKLDTEQHFKEIPAREDARAGGDDCQRRGNATDQDEHRSAEQPEREVSAERLEYDRHHQQSRDGDEHIAMAELHHPGLARLPAIKRDQSGASQ